MFKSKNCLQVTDVTGRFGFSINTVIKLMNEMLLKQYALLEPAL